MPLHDDGPGEGVALPDGRVIRNLTDDEYDALYDEGEPCRPIPEDVLAEAMRAADEQGDADG